MKILETTSWGMPNAERIPARRTKWCAKCECFHEMGYFWRRKGMTKSCGLAFTKSALGLKTA